MKIMEQETRSFENSRPVYLDKLPVDAECTWRVTPVVKVQSTLTRKRDAWSIFLMRGRGVAFTQVYFIKQKRI